MNSKSNLSPMSPLVSDHKALHTAPNLEQTLNPLDLEDLRRSGLSDETIRSMGIYSLSAHEIEDRLGIKTSSPGYAIPYDGIEDQTGQPYVRVRFQASVDKQRYATGRGDDPALYIPAGLARLEGRELLVVTEGEKKAAKAVQEGIPCVALQGVWSGSDPSARAVEKAAGLSVSQETPPLVALHDLAAKFRSVLVLGDSDLLAAGSGKSQARAGLVRLASALRNKGHQAYVQFCPPAPRRSAEEDEAAKQGLDDWLMERGSATVRKILPSLYMAGLIQSEELPETVIAQRFAMEYQDTLAFSPARGWMVYTGTKWEEDGKRNLRQKALEQFRRSWMVLANQLVELRLSATLGWPDEPKQQPVVVSSFAKRIADVVQNLRTANQRLGTHRGVEAILKLAQPDVLVADEKWDSDALLLGVANGIVDLRSGDLWPSRPEAYITRVAGTAFNPNAACPSWRRFLARVQPDPASRDALQRLAGYTLTGLADEQAAFFHHGEGANGKTTFLHTIAAVLKDYAVTAGAGLVDKKANHSEHAFELARLDGARMVTVSETEENTSLAMSIVKKIADPTTVTARYLYGSHFTFVPQCKLHLCTNHLPHVADSSHGAWRRLRVIPWAETISDAERDRNLMKTLLGELPGILCWMVEGAELYLKEGLKETSAGQAAVSVLRASCDDIQQWLDECVTTHATFKVGSTPLYASYVAWCQATRVQPRAQRLWHGLVKAKGFESKKDGKGLSSWIGLKVSAAGESSSLQTGSPALDLGSPTSVLAGGSRVV